MQQFCQDVELPEPVKMYIVDVCQATRTDPSLLMGASSRASIALVKASRVRAASQGRDVVLPDDVRALLSAVIEHRLILTPDAQLRDETVVRACSSGSSPASRCRSASASGGPSLRKVTCTSGRAASERAATRSPASARSSNASPASRRPGPSCWSAACSATCWPRRSAVARCSCSSTPASLMVVCAASRSRRKRKLTAERSALPTRMRVGQVAEVELTVRAPGRLRAFVVEEHLSSLLGDPVRVPVPTVGGEQEFVHTYAVRARRCAASTSSGRSQRSGPTRSAWPATSSR